MTEEDIDNRFDFHAAISVEKRMAHEAIREQCRVLAHKINEQVPEGREKSLAITKLEEVMFWSNAGTARMNTEGERL